MTLEEKINIIKEHKSAAIAALDSIIDLTDSYYSRYFDSNGKLVEGLAPDEQVENLIKDLKDDSAKYEIVRMKLQQDDFNLSALEISRIGIAFFFVELRLKSEREMIENAMKLSNTLYTQILDKLDTFIEEEQKLEEKENPIN